MPFVLDASVTLAWAFDDESSSYSDDVARRLASDSAATPPIWPMEVANILLSGERRGRISAAQRAAFVGRLEGLAISVDSGALASAFDVVLPLARAHNLTVYDATYLELAMRLGLPLASTDTNLVAAATRAGVPLFQP